MLYLGSAPHTKETLPDFREKCRVTRHSRVFRELTGSQRAPGIRGLTCSVQATAFRSSKEATEDEKKNGVLRRKFFLGFTVCKTGKKKYL